MWVSDTRGRSGKSSCILTYIGDNDDGDEIGSKFALLILAYFLFASDQFILYFFHIFDTGNGIKYWGASGQQGAQSLCCWFVSL